MIEKDHDASAGTRGKDVCPTVTTPQNPDSEPATQDSQDSQDSHDSQEHASSGDPTALGRPDPDQDLIRAFRAGRSEAFDQLVTRHQQRVYRMAYRLLGDGEQALDATQETFVKAWKALSRFKGDARFTTWLTRIAINQCKNELRKRGTVKHTRPLSLDEKIPGTETARVATLEANEGDAPLELAGAELAEAFSRAMLALEPEAREVLLLREVESLGYEDMAAVLDVPVGTVRSRLHRARAELKRRLSTAVA